MKEVWIEQDVGGLKLFTKHMVRSRKKKLIDLGFYLNKAVAIMMYGWAAVLSVFTVIALIRCF